MDARSQQLQQPAPLSSIHSVPAGGAYMAQPPPPYSFVSMPQSQTTQMGNATSSGRHQLLHRLTVRQQPKHSRMCGYGEKVDRRPIDPPPIIQLHVQDLVRPTPPAPEGMAAGAHPSNGNGGPLSMEESSPFLVNPYYFMFASLCSTTNDQEIHLLRDGKTRATTGSIVSSLFRLKDIDNSDGGFFVFPDLSVRMEGQYRLKFSLFEIVGNRVVLCGSILTDSFMVYAAKKFPGMEESTFLSRSFAEQGLKIRIRKEVRSLRRQDRALANAAVSNSPINMSPIGMSSMSADMGLMSGDMSAAMGRPPRSRHEMGMHPYAGVGGRPPMRMQQTPPVRYMDHNGYPILMHPHQPPYMLYQQPSPYHNAGPPPGSQFVTAMVPAEYQQQHQHQQHSQQHSQQQQQQHHHQQQQPPQSGYSQYTATVPSGAPQIARPFEDSQRLPVLNSNPPGTNMNYVGTGLPMGYTQSQGVAPPPPSQQQQQTVPSPPSFVGNAALMQDGDPFNLGQQPQQQQQQREQQQQPEQQDQQQQGSPDKDGNSVAYK